MHFGDNATPARLASETLNYAESTPVATLSFGRRRNRNVRSVISHSVPNIASAPGLRSVVFSYWFGVVL